ncbi:MAG: MBL fold metallo-hydrolase [Gammaproteobacteria bacterium]|nr:MBL fold metallo-hydrolase [Gammaproteobacteria bacterium]
MRFSMLGSGSRGNATLVEVEHTRLLIDCGFGLREAERRLARLGVPPESLAAILVTHEHDDHRGGVGRLAARHALPVWATAGTFAAWPDAPAAALRQLIDPHRKFAVGALQVEPLVVPHDAREACQFVISDGAFRLGVLSDAGHVTALMRERLSACDALLLEFNHDPQMLADGPYPPALKRRVGGDYGHLSNAQATQLLGTIDCSRLRHLVPIHLSEVNNTPARALTAAAAALGCAPGWLGCAQQDDGLAWRELRG